MKEKIEFNLDLYNTGKYDVVTRRGNRVEIKDISDREPWAIEGRMGCSTLSDMWTIKGFFYLSEDYSPNDLFLVEKEQPKEQSKEQPEEINEALVWAAMTAVSAQRYKNKKEYLFSAPFYGDEKILIFGEGSTPYAAAVELYKKLKGE